MDGTTQGFVTVAPGVELFYQEKGEGLPLLFIPGWTFSSEIFVRQFEGLARDHRVIALDPRSQGKSCLSYRSNSSWKAPRKRRSSDQSVTAKTTSEKQVAK